MHAVMFVRNSDELLEEVFPRMGHCDPEWQELREFYCPSCARQLEVEAVAPCYPVVHEFLPDVEGFYRGLAGPRGAVGDSGTQQVRRQALRQRQRLVVQLRLLQAVALLVLRASAPPRRRPM